MGYKETAVKIRVSIKKCISTGFVYADNIMYRFQSAVHLYPLECPLIISETVNFSLKRCF